MRTQKPLLLPALPLPPRSVPSHSSSCGRVSEGLFGVVPSLPPRRSPHIREMTPLPSHSTLQLCSATRCALVRSLFSLWLSWLPSASVLFRVPIRRAGLGIPFPPSFGSARLATTPLCHPTRPPPCSSPGPTSVAADNEERGRVGMAAERGSIGQSAGMRSSALRRQGLRSCLVVDALDVRWVGQVPSSFLPLADRRTS